MEFREIKDGYFAGSDGNIYYDGKQLKYTIHTKGYYQVYFLGQTYLVHRLIAEAFIPNPDKKPCVDHCNGDKLLNTPENLKWVTYKENNNNPITKAKNAEHAFKIGHNPYEGLSEESIRRMKDNSIKNCKVANQKRHEDALVRLNDPEYQEQLKERKREYKRSRYIPHPRVLLTEEEKKQRYLALHPNSYKYMTEEEKKAKQEEKKRLRYERNREKRMEYQRQYREEHLEEIRNKDRERKMKKYAEMHPNYVPYYHGY